MPAEALLTQIRNNAKPWALRDRRLLVTPMQATRLRSIYLGSLSAPEYDDLVRVVSESLSFEDFLYLLSEHQSVLSPPGKGHDCFRTWQAIAVGTVPLVVNDPSFDPRLYDHCGACLMPSIEMLTPQ